MEVAIEISVEQVISEQLDLAGIMCHPTATATPYMEPQRFAAFCADVAANNLLVLPIKSADGMLVDGRHRVAAYLLSGRKLSDLEFAALPVALTDSQSGTVAGSLNLNRRHLTPGQAAMLVAELRAKGANIYDLLPNMPTSKESVERASRVLRHGSQALVADVKSGLISVSQADKIATGKALVIEAGKVANNENFDLVEDDGNAEPAATPTPKRAGRPPGNSNVNRLYSVLDTLCKLIEAQDNSMKHLRLSSDRRKQMLTARRFFNHMLAEDRTSDSVIEQADSASVIHH